MPRPELRSTLEELHQQLDKARLLDETERDLLRALASDIQEVLARAESEPARPDDDSLVERAREAVERFEGSHPTLTATLGRIIDQLSNLGI